MRFGSLFSGIGGFDAGFEMAGMEAAWQVELEPFCRKVLRKRFPHAQLENDITTCLGLTSSVPASHARTFPSQANGQDSPGHALDSFTSLRESCVSFDPLGLCSKMFPDFSVRTVDETLQKSSAFSWSSAGMGFAGVCSTASFSESPNAVAVCSLSDVLESHVPQRFFLSPRAAQGILRRAEKRGRTLPHRLQAALESLATIQDKDGRTISTSSNQNSSGCEPSETTKPQPQPQPLNSETTKTLPTSFLQTHSENQTGTTGEALHEAMDATTSLSPHSTAEATAADSGLNRESILLSKTCEAAPETRQTTAKESESPKADPATHSQRPSSRKQNQDRPGRETQPLLSVRRLTPTECETLQGFPSGWTVPDIEL